jgi:hypothetical protein
VPITCRQLETIKRVHCRKPKKTKKNKSNSIKICPEGKELNSRTNRCVKKCPNGYLRNEKPRCFK